MTSKLEKPFDEEMLDVMNKAALALMLSVGHRTNLFDAMAKLPPSTSADIASSASLDERYVREWLGALVTSKIIDYDSSSKLYSLSKEKAEFLTRDGSYNFASSMQWIPALVEEILPLLPNFDKFSSGIKVLDVGCGSGSAINLMAKAFPNSQFVGYDFSSEAIENAKNEAKKLHLTNITFEKQDVSKFSKDGYYDVITAFDAIHDQAEPDKVLENIKKSLKPDGIFLMQDIRASSYLEKNLEHSLAPYLYTVSCLHCMTVSLAQKGKGLGAMWGKEVATEMLKDAGFSNVDVKELPHDPINYFYIVKS